MSEWRVDEANKKLLYGKGDFFIFTLGLYGEFRRRVRGESRIDVGLEEHFKDWTRPTEAEAILFELEFGIPYVPQDLLDRVRREGE